MHKTFATGKITKDGSTLRTVGNSGDKVLGFSLAVSNGKDAQGNWRDKTFFDCSVWGKRATSLEQYLTAGKSLTVFGRIGARAHDGKAYLQISVDEIAFNEASTSDGGGQSQGYDSGSTGNYDAPSGYGAGGNPNAGRDLGDEIPFKYSDL